MNTSCILERQESGLLELLRIAGHADSQREIRTLTTEKTPFQLATNRWVGLSEYAHYLRECYFSGTRKSVEIHRLDIADRAYDLTLDKFTNVPQESDPDGVVVEIGSKNSLSTQTDCRRYYRALLRMVDRDLEQTQTSNMAETEMIVASAFQRFVRRHFFFSIREAQRQLNPHASRYTWSTPSGAMVLVMPTSMNGPERRRWLEERFGDIDARDPGAREQVQLVVDNELLRDVVVPLDAVSYELHDSGDLLSWAAYHEISIVGIAESLAREKSAQFECLRPAIRHLGKDGVYRLVHRVVRETSSGTLSEATLASEFNLSRPALSRFAGTRWRRDTGPGRRRIPDLWRNLARVISHDEKLQEAARSVGVWESVKSYLAPVEQGGRVSP